MVDMALDVEEGTESFINAPKKTSKSLVIGLHIT